MSGQKRRSRTSTSAAHTLTSAAFAIEPDAGNCVSLSVDGLALGARQAYAFSDVFVYKVALTDAERQQLETHLAKTLTE